VEEVCVAGESPGREQQHEASGEVADRMAPDPRLAVFRASTGTREAPEVRLTPDVREEHAGPATAAAEPSPATEPLVEDGAGAPAGRPHPSPLVTRTSDSAASGDVDDVDADPGSATPGTPPGPRTPSVDNRKPESNRDQAADPEEAPEGAGQDAPDETKAVAGAEPDEADAAAAGGSAQDADGVDDADGDAADDVADAEAGREDADEAGDAAGEPDATTPSAEDGARTGDGQDGTDREDAEVAGDAGDAPADAESAADAAPEAIADAADASGAESDADSAPEDAPKDADSAPKDAKQKDAEPKEPDARPSGGAPAGRLVRPLVSDLPESRVTYGTPGTPTRADTSPQAPARREAPAAPSRPAPAPRKPAAAPVPLPPEAATASATEEGEVVGPDGTRSMPVPLPPSQAPLKLLAELTNTPPPPQTALRTVARRFKIWTPLVLLLAIVFVVVQALRPLPSPALESTAAASYTFDGTPLPQSMPWPAEGQSAAEVEGLGSLGVHGAQTPVPIASVTKVMTAWVILKDHPLSGKQDGPVITVDKQAAQEAGSEDESTAPVKENQKFTERQMLQLLLIPSGNNIARLLARWDSGTQEAFVAKMQRTAAQLGMTHTTYTGASGFESTTRSTAVDLLKLDRVVMKNDVFRWVVGQPNVTLPGVGRIFNNNQDLVHPGVIGVKTGSSTPAGGALMWAAQKKIGGKEQLILGVTLQQHGGSTPNESLQVALDRSLALMQSAQGGLTTATIVKKGEVVGHVDDGLGGSTPVVAGRDLTAIGWPGMKTGLTVDPIAAGIPHSGKAGTQVGTLSFGTGAARTSVPVVLQSAMSEPSFGAKLTRLG
jgi:D-alanyl-D-alanine carboxypeptidase